MPPRNLFTSNAFSTRPLLGFTGGFGTVNPVSDFYVAPPTVRMDELVEKVIKDKLTEKLSNLKPEEADADEDSLENFLNISVPPNSTPTMKDRLVGKGLTARISKVSQRIRKSNVEHTTRWLLSFEPIYVYLLFKAVYADKVEDEDGIFSRVLAGEAKIRQFLSTPIVETVLETKRIDAKNDLDKIAGRLVSANMPYLSGQVEPFVLNLVEEVSTYGKLPELVDKFFSSQKKEIDPGRGTPQVKALMVQYLDDIGLRVDPGYNITPTSTKFDEYLALAYSHALKNIGNQDDPRKTVFGGGTTGAWDFSVDYFETTQQQGIVPENIRAAGALYYIHILADQLRVLPITNAIIMAWTSGRLDIPQGPTASKLYDYYKLLEFSTTENERAMFLSQVLGMGNAKLLDNMTVNRDFPMLWDTLMSEVVKYIHKFEQRDNSSEVVSKQPVYQAMRDTGYNLTTHASGMVKQLLPEMYAQLQNALDILQEPEIVSQLGYGLDKSMWKVIERVSQEEFGYVPNISALRTSAVKGHKIFSHLAFFDEAQFPEETFREFINDVESFIIAQSQLSDSPEEGYGKNGTYHQNGETNGIASNDEWDF